MANDIQRIFQRCYVQLQGAFDTIPNSGGTATVGNSDCMLITSLELNATQEEIDRPDKTGTYDEPAAQGGRRVGSWSISFSAAGNGSAGVAPDCAKLLQAAMGTTAVVVAGTSVKYPLGDNLYYLTIWHFNAPSTATQQVAFNALVQKIVFEIGGNVPMITVSGECGWVYDSAQAADAGTDTLASGGLSAFPSEPSSPVVNGTHPPGFKITGVLDGNSYSTIQRVTITVEVQRELRKDTNSEFPRAGAAGKRMVTADIEMTDDDDAGTTTLKQKSENRTAIAATFTVGAVAGNRWVHALTGLRLRSYQFGDAGVRRSLMFRGCRAYPSSIAAKDQYYVMIN